MSDPLMRETWPEAIYPRHHHTRRSYTIETSSTQLLQPRITTQVAAVTMVLATLVSAQAR